MNTILGELGKSKKFVELIKNIEEKQEKLEKELFKYQGSAAYIKQNIEVMLKTISR